LAHVWHSQTPFGAAPRSAALRAGA
jgi:hypothetical protein